MDIAKTAEEGSGSKKGGSQRFFKFFKDLNLGGS